VSSSISIFRAPAKRRGLWRWCAAAAAGFAGALLLIAGAVLAFVDDDTIQVYKRDMLAWKLARLEAPDRPPHLIVISGSNALYSIDSPTLEAALGRPVTNLAQHWGLGLYAAERLTEHLRPGDVVLAPLEYEYYLPGGEQSGVESCYLIAHDRNRIDGLAGWLHAFTTCSPVLLAGGVAIKLMSYVGLGYPRVAMADILNAQGDITDNDPARASWRGGTGGVAFPGPAVAPLSLPRLERIMAGWRAKGATVLLSFPAQPQTEAGTGPVGPAWLAKFRDWAARQGAHIVSTPEAHQFPADCFFDSPYHLHRGCTVDNSKRYAAAIKPFLN